MPLRKRKKRKKKIWPQSKAGWVILTGALVCIAVVVAASLLGRSDFQPISYNPAGEDPTGTTPGGDVRPGWDVEIKELDWPSYVTFTPAGNVNISYDPELNKTEKKAIIENTYTKIFSTMEARYRQEINRLVESAKADYIAVQKGQKDISIGRLALAYVDAGKQLEKEADRSFNRVLGNMRAELQAQGLSTDMADRAEKHYKEQKSQLRKEMLQQMARYVND
ncbi:hypothetical protein [Desulfallas thermosapovorans]|uniref:Uncharacterized protein n=1 Tax=Desulfallas thermosapovorans DSM 6562 TaxID=1121431 RepID=A0A5S4ZNP9_9FIRM|nr:hypothetical protein [Desulfallas thermosapovorans]TYO93255.1 hypothetical protein LX24_02784 [Desulfallas thermosapovorans DSM 6562]